jgi:hypothetical protein
VVLWSALACWLPMSELSSSLNFLAGESMRTAEGATTSSRCFFLLLYVFTTGITTTKRNKIIKNYLCIQNYLAILTHL